MLSRLSVSKGWHYWFSEEMPGFADTSFGQDTKAVWIGRQPELVALNSLDARPSFLLWRPTPGGVARGMGRELFERLRLLFGP